MDHEYVAKAPPLGQPLPDNDGQQPAPAGPTPPSDGAGYNLTFSSSPSSSSLSSSSSSALSSSRPTPVRDQRKEDEGERVLKEVERLVAAERDEALLLQLCAHHLSGVNFGTSIREALVRAAAAADLPHRLSLLAALQVHPHSLLAASCVQRGYEATLSLRHQLMVAGGDGGDGGTPFAQS